MSISRAMYYDSARRVSVLVAFVFPGFCAVGFLAMIFVGLPVAAAVRDLVGGNVGMALAIVLAAPFVLLPLALPMAVMNVIDRRIGIRCPNCGVSLTIRCMPEKVLITRRCSHCDATVLLDEKSTISPPKTRPWVIVALVLFGVLGIAVAITLYTIAPANDRLSLRDELRASGILLVGVLAMCCIQSVVISIMKRRWKRQSIIDGSKENT